MALANFWISAAIDGKAKTIEHGSDGGFTLGIRQRDKGELVQILTVFGSARQGKLELVVYDAEHNLIHTHTVEQEKKWT